MFNSWAFKINIPKAATIDKAVFTCTTSKAGKVPTYDIYFHAVSPDKSLIFLQTCEFKDVEKLSDEFVSWEFTTENLEANVQVSSDKIKNLLQNFINHGSYEPGTFFQLVVLDTLASNLRQDAIWCHNFNGGLTKRPNQLLHDKINSSKCRTLTVI